MEYDKSGNNLTGPVNSKDARHRERLIKKYSKAVEVLDSQTNKFKGHVIQAKKSSNVLQNEERLDLNNTDYVPYCRKDLHDISDLVMDKSITLEGSSMWNPETVHNQTDVSFNAGGITGHSTVHNKNSRDPKPAELSVAEILESSYSQKVRDLHQPLTGYAGDDSSSRSGNRNIQKNPHLTNISSTSKSILMHNTNNELDDLSKTSEVGLPFNNISQQAIDLTCPSDNFISGDRMQSQLLQDEISWANKHAAIPISVLCEEARNRLLKRTSPDDLLNSFNSSLTSLAGKDPNFSAGQFFKTYSDSINNIIQKRSPYKNRNPITSINDSMMTTTIRSPDQTLENISPLTPLDVQNDDNTTKLEIKNCNEINNLESKSSTRATEKSDLLCSSTIDRVCGNINKNFDKIVNNSVRRIVSKTKQNPILPRTPQHPIEIVITEPSTDDYFHDGDTEDYSNSPIISPNRRKRFTKSPQMSPLKLISKTNIIQTIENEKINIPQKPPFTENKTPKCQVPLVPTKVTPKTVDKMQTKSINSIRLEDEQNSPNGDNDGISKSLTKLSKTLTPTQIGESTGSNSFDLSPLSSSHNCASLSTNSPGDIASSISSNRSTNTNGTNYKNSRCSPRFDSTTNSEQRFLNTKANGEASGDLRRIASSPRSYEISTLNNSYKKNYTGNYGVPPLRTYSSTSIRSTESTSRCSNNSEFSHRDGKMLPLKATTLELAWGSVKLRTSSLKSVQVKNTSDKRLVTRIEISGPGFELVGRNSNMVTFQSQECCTISINFHPTVIGMAIGKLIFKSPKCQNNSNANCINDIIIPLYAYGGHAHLIIQNIVKGPVGTPFLPMGELCELIHIQPLERTFQIHNKGTLVGFALVCIELSGSHVPGLSTAFEIFPQCLLIEPQSVATVRLVFQPNREDIKKIKKLIHEVLTLAKMRIIYGDDVMRQRLRVIQRNMVEETRERLFTKSLDKLWTRFPGERAVFSTDTFKESNGLAQDMWTNFAEQEIALTLNNNMDETEAELSTIFTETDNTILFRTMCVLTPIKHVETVDEQIEDSCIVATETGTWSVSPDRIKFNFNNQLDGEPEKSSLAVSNHSNERQYFEVFCDHRDMLCFMPSYGYVEPNGSKTVVQIYIHPAEQTRQWIQNLNIVVEMGKEKITVPVQIPTHFRSCSSVHQQIQQKSK